MKSAERGLKGTWPQALVSFLGPLAIILIVRWAVLEPFVIPSGSMIPNLLVNDHIFVKKFSYGLRVPFTDHWLVRWSDPRPGDMIVFRYPNNPSVFFIKRLIAGPGSKVRLREGRFTVNGQEWGYEPAPSVSDSYVAYLETIPGREPHVVRYIKDQDREDLEWTVPKGQYFFVGDNRDESSDSRVWGFVAEDQLLGKAWFIWLSCDEMMESAKFVCDPASVRWSRIFTRLE